MLGKIDVTVRNLCPLIQNRDNGEREKKPKKDYGSQEEKKREFKEAQYRDKKGRLYQPAEHFEKSFEIAARQFKFKGNQSYSKILEGGISVEPEEILHKKRNKPIPFEKYVKIPPKKGARVPKTRAMIKNWELDLTINVFNDSINFKVLKDIVIYAGAYIGIGDWRPKYGRFEVIKFKERKKNE